MSQDDIDMRHDRWIKLIETFLYMIKCNEGKDNVVENVLIRRHALLVMLDSIMLYFVYSKEPYKDDDVDVGSIYEHVVVKGSMDEFCLFDRSLFGIDNVCLTRYALRLLIVEESHKDTLIE